MGANVSTVIEKVQNGIKNDATIKAKASAFANCTTTVGSIKGDGCGFDFDNQCNADAVASTDAVINSAARVWSEANAEQKAAFNWGNINVSTLTRDVDGTIRNAITAECSGDAETISKYLAGNIDLKNCPTGFKVLNLGNAKGNCASRVVIDAITNSGLSSDVTQIAEISLANLFGLGQGGSLISVSSCVVLICIILIVVGFLGYTFIQGGGIETVGKYGAFGPAAAFMPSR